MMDSCFCSQCIEQTRLGQLQLVNCDVFKTTTVVHNKGSFLSNECEENVMLVRQGQSSVDEQSTSYMLLIASG